MRFHSLLRRRPSPAIVISSVALFMSLGGVGYAATQLPSNSVGSAQIRNNAVTYKKIEPGAVGLVRANLGQLQERVSGTCSSNNAITSIDQSGKVACNSTLPGETGTTSNTTTIPTSGASTGVTSTNLAAGSSYLTLADPTATVTAATGVTTDNRVNVTCTLTVGSNTQTRSLTLNTGTVGIPASGSIPLQLAGPSGTSSVACSSTLPTGQTMPTTAPTVSVTSALNAIQVAG